MASTPAQVTGRQLVPFAALSATYFAHIGFFNPYLPLWLKQLGLPIVVISLLTSVQSFTRVFAPYAWGALSDHTGERVRLLRISAALALVVSGGLWLGQGAWWIGLVLLVLFTCTSSMMSLTEAAMAHLVAGDWGRYGRVRLWGEFARRYGWHWARAETSRCSSADKPCLGCRSRALRGGFRYPGQ